jgi:hypothetical protein
MLTVGNAVGILGLLGHWQNILDINSFCIIFATRSITHHSRLLDPKISSLLSHDIHYETLCI